MTNEEIKFDYGEFMKVYEVNKNQKSNFKEDFHRHTPSAYSQRESASLKGGRPHSASVSSLIKREFQSNKPKPTKEQVLIAEASPKKRPQSKYSKAVKHDYERLMRQSHDIM